MKHPIPLWTEGPEQPGPDRPATGPVSTLDVRSILAMGEEPFQDIMAAVDALPRDGVLELVAPFAPVPLYAVLGNRGYAHVTRQREDGAFVVRFTPTGILPSTPVREVIARHPATAPVLAEYGFDLCCGGKHSLEFASKAHGVDLPALLGRLQAAAVS